MDRLHLGQKPRWPPPLGEDGILQMVGPDKTSQVAHRMPWRRLGQKVEECLAVDIPWEALGLVVAPLRSWWLMWVTAARPFAAWLARSFASVGEIDLPHQVETRRASHVSLSLPPPQSAAFKTV